MGWKTGVPFLARERFFLFSRASRPVLRPRQPPVQFNAEINKVELYFHSSTSLHGVVLNKLSTGRIYLLFKEYECI
jgi:hypothetical protein